MHDVWDGFLDLKEAGGGMWPDGCVPVALPLGERDPSACKRRFSFVEPVAKWAAGDKGGGDLGGASAGGPFGKVLGVGGCARVSRFPDARGGVGQCFGFEAFDQV